MQSFTKHVHQFLMDQTTLLKDGYESHKHQILSKTLIYLGGLTTTLFVRILYLKIRNRLTKKPPQLYGVPFFGSLFTMIFWKNNFNTNLLPKYGDIVTYNVGTIKFCQINDLQLIKELFSSGKTNDRPSLGKIIFEPFGIQTPVSTCNVDENWSHRRKILMTCIARLLEKTQLEANITDILQRITYKQLNSNIENSIKTGGGKYIWYPRKCLANAAFNLIHLATFGKTLFLDDERYINYTESNKRGTENGTAAVLAQVLPKFIADITGLTAKMEIAKREIRNFVFVFLKGDFDEVTGKAKKSSDGIIEDPKTIAELLYNEF